MGNAQLKGVVAGAGYFSQFHFDAWQRMPGVDLCAVCDLDQDRAAAAARQWDIAHAYGDAAAMLEAERPDFIDVITPPSTHVELGRLAGEAGVHVVCQKPLAPSFAEARSLVDDAEACGIRLMAHDNFRFQPWHRELRRLQDDGAIGRLHTIECRTRTGDGWGDDAYLSRQPYFRTMPQLLVFETGVHIIDVFRYLAGEITEVYAKLRRLNPAIAGEDAGLLLFTFTGGATGLWDANRYNETRAADARYTFGEFVLEGDRGSVHVEEDGRIVVHPLGEAPRVHPYEPPRRGFAGDSCFAALAHFVACLRDEAPFETDGREYLRTLAVQEAVYESARTNRPVQLPGGA